MHSRRLAAALVAFAATLALTPARADLLIQIDKSTQEMTVTADGARFVLVEGLHRLEAAKALGEQTIIGFRVDARKH